MSNPTFEIIFSPVQTRAFQALESPTIDELLMGGAKGGGKTVFGCKYTFYYCKRMIQFFDLKPSPYPPVIGFIGRKQGVDFNTTTLNTWKRDIPAAAYEIKQQQKLIVIENRIALQYGGLDDQSDIAKFNSAEYAYAWLDQAEECSEKDVGMLRGAMRFKLKGKQPPYKLLLTCNPVISDDPDYYYLKRDFIDNPLPRTMFIKALYTDNHFLPKNYGDQLDRAYSFNPDLHAAYKFGEWDRAKAANVVIPSQFVKECVNNPIVDNSQLIKRVTVCDVAGGDDEGTQLSNNDETVIYDLENTHIKDQEIYSHRQDMDTCGRIVSHQKRNNSSVICVDKVGIGSGIYQRLREIYEDDIRSKKIVVYGFDSRVTPPAGLDEETYLNYRAYAYFNASKKYFLERKCYLPNDPILISQLSSITFYFKSNGKMAITQKDKIRAKIGMSPDRADAYIMGLDALDKATTFKRVTENKNGWQSGAYTPSMLTLR